MKVIPLAAPGFAIGHTTIGHSNAERHVAGSIEVARLCRKMTSIAAREIVITKARRLPIRWSREAAGSNMTMTPRRANRLATTVGQRSRSPRNSHASAPVMNGLVALITATSATVVSRRALRKQMVAKVEKKCDP